MAEPREPEERGAELEELRALWREARPARGPEHTGEALEDTDARTRAAVEWMRAAWSELEVPEPRVPARPARGRLLAFPWRSTLAVAAAFLLALTLWLLLDPEDARRGLRPGDDGELVAQVPAGGEPSSTRADPGATGPTGALGATGPTGSSAATTAHVPTTTREAPRAPRVEPLVPEVGEGNLEFRSGPVRLVLVTGARDGSDNPGDER